MLLQIITYVIFPLVINYTYNTFDLLCVNTIQSKKSCAANDICITTEKYKVFTHSTPQYLQMAQNNIIMLQQLLF